LIDLSPQLHAGLDGAGHRRKGALGASCLVRQTHRHADEQAEATGGRQRAQGRDAREDAAERTTYRLNVTSALDCDAQCHVLRLARARPAAAWLRESWHDTNRPAT